MEKMYQDYKDIAEFRLVYINEAHAADSSWSVPYAKDLGINNHKNYGERCSVATKLLSDKSLNLPTIIDGMDNKVNEAYKAHPDRIFLVRKDGRLAVAAKRGPWGFKPALNATKTWLASYKETGVEPKIDSKSANADGAAAKKVAMSPKIESHRAAMVLGDWSMKTQFNGNAIEATMTLSLKDGRLAGNWQSQGRAMAMSEITLAGKELSFKRSLGGDNVLAFKGTVDGTKISGKYTGVFGELDCAGERNSAAAAAFGG